MVQEIGFDLVSADKLASDINYRRMLTIVILYLTILMLAICIVLTFYYKAKYRWFA